MKTKLFFTVCAMCLFIISCLAQELTKKAIVSWKENNVLNASGKFMDVLIKDGILVKTDVFKNVATNTTTIIEDLLSKNGVREFLMANIDEYSVICITVMKYYNGKEDYDFLLVILKDGIVCHFYANGEIYLIEFMDNRGWSFKTNDIIESIRNFFVTTVERY